MSFVFGYGSLAADFDGVAVRLRGYRRVWGVAMDNRVDLPGYKHYLLRSDGSRPAVHVAFLDLARDEHSEVHGIATPVDDARLAELDRRERNYVRVDVSEQVAGVDGIVWAYLGSPAGRDRLREARARGEAVISHDYLASVRAGSAALEPAQRRAFERTCDPGGLEIWDLELVPHSDTEGR